MSFHQSLDWEQQLRSQHPAMFRDYLPGRLFEVGEGWIPLVQQTIERLHALGEEHGQQVGILQIKEKFGELTIYVWYGEEISPSFREAVEGVLKESLAQSRITCEECGKPGARTSTKGWVTVRCQQHAFGR